MKRLYIAILGVMLSMSVAAQNPTTYFMEGSIVRNQWNAAFAPQRGYVNIPVAGNIQLSTSGNIALSDIIYNQGGSLSTIFSSAVPASVALSNLNSRNVLGLSSSMNIIGFGAYRKDGKTFWSFDLNTRVDLDAEAPYELFEFFKTGKSTTFNNVNLGVKGYVEAAFSYSFPICDKIYLGARAKFLVGVANMRASIDSFTAQLDEERWLADAEGSIEMWGMEMEPTRSASGERYYDLEDMDDLSTKMPAGYGFGFDLGVTYDVLPQLQISASVNDIGAIFWSKGKSSIGRIDADDMEYTGVYIDENGNSTQPTFDFDELTKAEVLEQRGLSSSLNTSINLGAEYNFLERKIGLGLLYTMRFYDYKTRHNLTASANFRPLKWLHVTGSYSFVDNGASAIGLALNICPSFINFFVGTDILLSKRSTAWIPIKQKTMNLTFGLGVPIGKRSQRGVEKSE